MKPMIILFSLVASTLLAQNPEKPTVKVSGEGVILVVPDMVNISVEVINEGEASDNIRTIKSQNDETVSKVLKFLKNSNISEKDYKTQHINLAKYYDHNTQKYIIKASQNITILLRDINKYDSIIQGLIEAGINQINSVNFNISNREEYYTKAREKAILNAQQKAKEYTETLGQSIGKAIQITDITDNSYYPMNTLEAVVTSEKINSGTLAIKSQVNVSFELK